MTKSTLEKRITKNLKKFERVDTNWEKAQVIHSLIHKISEIYFTPGPPDLTTLERNLVEDLWCDLYLMVEDVAEPIRERKGTNMFDHLFDPDLELSDYP